MKHMKYVKRFESMMDNNNSNYYGIRSGDIVIFNLIDGFHMRWDRLTTGKKYVLHVYNNSSIVKDEVDYEHDIISVIDNDGKICYMFANNFIRELVDDAKKYNL